MHAYESKRWKMNRKGAVARDAPFVFSPRYNPMLADRPCAIALKRRGHRPRVQRLARISLKTLLYRKASTARAHRADVVSRAGARAGRSLGAIGAQRGFVVSLYLLPKRLRELGAGGGAVTNGKPVMKKYRASP